MFPPSLPSSASVSCGLCTACPAAASSARGAAASAPPPRASTPPRPTSRVASRPRCATVSIPLASAPIRRDGPQALGHRGGRGPQLSLPALSILDPAPRPLPRTTVLSSTPTSASDSDADAAGRVSSPRRNHAHGGQERTLQMLRQVPQVNLQEDIQLLDVQ